MKSKDLILLFLVAGVAYYVWKKQGTGSQATSQLFSGAPVSTVGSQTNYVGGSNPYETVHLSVTDNPVTAIPGTSTAYNSVLPPSQQVDPNDPPPVLCFPGQWPTRGANGTWGCAPPQLMI